MTRITRVPSWPESDFARSSGPEKGVHVLLTIQDGTTPYTWRAFGIWSVPGEAIARAMERWGLPRPGPILVLRISASVDRDGGEGFTPAFRDIAVRRPGPAWHMIGLEGGRAYTLLLGVLASEKVFRAVAGPKVIYAPPAGPRRPVRPSRNNEPLRMAGSPPRRSHV